MRENNNNIRSVFKATAILSSVQFFNILIGVVRNKIVSMILGPTGMGVVGLMQSTSQTISGFTNCGVSVSSVKNVAQAYENKDISLLGKTIYVLKRLVACAGSLAILVMLILSKKLSQWSFGNDDYALSFVCLSISLLFSQATQAYQTIIKGCRRIYYYARANVIGNLSALIISIPLYFIWGEKAIVPVLILVSLCTCYVAYLYENRLGIKEIKAEGAEFRAISFDILRMGIPLAISEIFPIMASYLIRLFVSSGNGGVADVGLYSAGFAILNGYVGMIFTAMSSDFIPRLSATVDDNKACEGIINNQILLSILILFPILSILIALCRVVVVLLYSKAFLAMTGMICWGALGMLLKTYNWCFGCILIPKRDSKPFFYFSILSALVYLGTSIAFYSFWGLTGLGIAFLVSHTWDFIVSVFFVGNRYGIRLSVSLIVKLVLFSLVLVIMIFLTTVSSSHIYIYIIEALIVLAVSAYSLWSLNRVTNLTDYVKNRFCIRIK